MNIDIEKALKDYPQNELINIWSKNLSMLTDSKIIRKRIDWAYNNNFCGKGQMWLLREKESGEYFGCSALLPRSFLLNGKKEKGALIADTAIKKKYRSLGPALKLHKKILNESTEFSFVMAFPNSQVEDLLKAVGFKPALCLIHVVRILNTKLFFNLIIKNKWILNFFAPLTYVIDSIVNIIDLKKRKNKKYIGHLIDSFDKNINILWNEFRKNYNFIVEKRADYLNWKYIKNPHRDYKIFIVKKKKTKRVCGYYVYYVKNFSLFIDDFLWIENDIKFDDFISVIVNYAQKSGLRSVSFYVVEKSIIHKNLSKRLFFHSRVKQDQPVMYFILKDSIKSLLPVALSKPFLTAGDNDI